MRQFIIPMVLGLSALTTQLMVAPATAQEAAKTLQAEDIFALEWANDVQISPNGRYVVYVRHGFDIMKDNTKRALWLVDTETGSHTPLFDDQHSYSNPSWSPDGSKLAFSSNRDGRNQIHVYYMATKTSSAITEVTESPRQFSWSPDSKHLAFLMNVAAEKTEYAKAVKKPKAPKGAKWAKPPVIVERTYYQRDGAGVLPDTYSQIFVVPSDGGSARQLTSGDFSHNGPLAWVDGGKALVFSANRNDDWEYQVNESDLWKVAVQDGALTQVTDMPGREWSPVTSPNGEQLAFLHRGNEAIPYHNAKLRIMDLDDNDQRELLSDFDRSVDSPQWISNDRLAIQYADRGRYKLAEVRFNGNRNEWVDDVGGVSVSRPYMSGMFSVAAGGDKIAYTRGSSYRPADVAVFDIPRRGAAKPQSFTALNDDVLGHRKLGKVNEFTYNSSYDDTEIHGWYITPPDYDPNKKYPLLLEIHGGPHLAYSPMFAAEQQRYAAEGYIVFYNNYRGSTSYGAEHALKLDGFYSSERDHADHMSGIDVLIDKGMVDPNNLFIAGGSAGGIATAYAVGLTDRFNAAAATNPVINWISKTLTADSYLGQITNQFPAMPWEDYAHYWKRSPLSMVGKVNTPVMLFSGENDRRVPMSEIEQFYQALQLRKVDTAMVRVPDASHGVTARPSNMIAKIEHTLAWFKLYHKK
ncbi:S9 family peptidase [Pseudidiomarina andamanensis]|nr:S9 family peptidase [Pseudidiomarina andamanensis]MDS0219047.1 S9 family peptidase [Pseudidiomarina andamanensis]